MPVRPPPATVAHRKVVLNGSSEPVSLSELGFGLMSLSIFQGGINDPNHCPEDVALEVIGRALDAGINLVNSASFYGSGRNEVILGKAIQKFGRERFFITDKFGAIRNQETGQNLRYDASRDSVKEQLDASLARLGTTYLDCYLPARITPDTPIEETVAALAELIKEGKLRYVGLSEANAETIRRAHAVYPVAFLETEFSMFSRHIEKSILPTCRELGVKILAYSPLGRGLLTGTVTQGSELAANDMRRYMPRFQGDNLTHNLALVSKLTDLANQNNCSHGQLAIAWLMQGNEDIFPIPGTKVVARLDENLGAAGLKLSEGTMKAIADALDTFETKGLRYPAEGMGIIDWQESPERERLEKEAREKRGKM